MNTPASVPAPAPHRRSQQFHPRLFSHSQVQLLSARQYLKRRDEPFYRLGPGQLQELLSAYEGGGDGGDDDPGGGPGGGRGEVIGGGGSGAFGGGGSTYGGGSSHNGGGGGGCGGRSGGGGGALQAPRGGGPGGGPALSPCKGGPRIVVHDEDAGAELDKPYLVRR